MYGHGDVQLFPNVNMRKRDAFECRVKSLHPKRSLVPNLGLARGLPTQFPSQLLSVASERDIAIISRVERIIDTNLAQQVKRGKISKQDFDDIVAVYGKLTNESTAKTEIRKRVKQMMLNRGWTGKRRRWLFNSRRWFNRI